MNLSFRYAETEKDSLHGITTNIPIGQKSVILGPSGSGKTTFTRILMGFLQPNSGRIWVNDYPLDIIDKEIWRKNISWISQSPFLFHTTIRENLLMAKPDATETELNLALDRSHVADFVQSLSKGLNTIVGERGTRLSVGQIQRVALARALLKNAPILILDEPSSNLDVELEKQVNDSISNLEKNKTVLVVAHRLQTVIHADRILLFSKSGRIVADGTHQQLLKNSSAYRSLLQKGGHDE